jgi:large subunit ribosomal protein L32e
MADTHEKKVEKKVVKETVARKPSEPDHKAESPVHKAAAPVHKAVEPAPKAPEHVGGHAHKAESPVHKAPAAKALADEIEKELESAKPATIKKVEAKPRAEAKPEAKAAEKPAEPAAETKTPEPTGEVEAEIVEDAEEKKEAEKPKKKKGKKERKPHIKPQLAAGVVEAMALRKKLKDKTPNFIRQDAYNYGRLGNNWRKPQGTHSKLRHHINYRINVVSIGYGGPNASKGLHPSGFREVLVHHPLELDKVDPKTEAARIAHGVGVRKRMMIEQRAQRKGIRVLNEMQE